MSLSRRLFLSITALIMILLVANLCVSLLNAKRYLSDQLQVLAEDTATSLGLTISHSAAQNDEAQTQTMINVIFDRGYYLSIIYSDLEGNVIVSRSRDVKVKGVPNWFVKLVDIPLRTGKTDIVSGWYQLGSLSVVVHPGYAYRDIWRVFNDQIWLFLFAAVLFYGATGQMLKVLLKPLYRLEKQANAICRKEFILQHPVPKSKELKMVVEAMNRMVAKVSDMFAFQVDITNQLRKEASLDALTGLPNKNEFDARLSAWLKSEQGGGSFACLLLNVKNLKKINDEYGAALADSWLCHVANHVCATLAGLEDAFIARRSGGDFSVTIPAIDNEQMNQICSTLITVTPDAEFSDLCSLNIGAMLFDQSSSLSEILTATDGVLRKSSLMGNNHYLVERYDSASILKPASSWRPLLENIAKQKSVYLHSQPIVQKEHAAPLYQEVFARIKIEGKEVHAGIFWPFVERLNLDVHFDDLVLEKIVGVIKANELSNVRFGVNISPRSINAALFLDRLESELADTCIAKKLVFELPERALLAQSKELERFIHIVSNSEAGLALDRFGIVPSSLGCLQSVPLEYVKIDSRFVADIETHVQNQFYVRNLISIARSCDVVAIAEGVETAKQWQKLVELGVDAGQGYYFSSPTLLS